MYNIFIYGGLGILLLGSLIMLAAAVKGFILQKRGIAGPVIKQAISGLLKPSYYITVLGFVLIGIGIAMSCL